MLGIDALYTGGALKSVAQEGSRALDLTGAGYQGAVALSQTLTLSAGQYMLGFYLGDIDGRSVGNSFDSRPSSVEVLFGGSSLGIFSSSGLQGAASGLHGDADRKDEGRNAGHGLPRPTCGQ